MNLPSLVFFFSGGRALADRWEPRELLRVRRYGEGSDELETRACACCSPRGSFRLWNLESKMTEPGTSSVKGSSKIPSFDFRGDGPAFFSFVAEGLPEPSVGLWGLHLPSIAMPGDLGFGTEAETTVSRDDLWVGE